MLTDTDGVADTDTEGVAEAEIDGLALAEVPPAAGENDTAWIAHTVESEVQLTT